MEAPFGLAAPLPGGKLVLVSGPDGALYLQHSDGRRLGALCTLLSTSSRSLIKWQHAWATGPSAWGWLAGRRGRPPSSRRCIRPAPAACCALFHTPAAARAQGSPQPPPLPSSHLQPLSPPLLSPPLLGSIARIPGPSEEAPLLVPRAAASAAADDADDTPGAASSSAPPPPPPPPPPQSRGALARRATKASYTFDTRRKGSDMHLSDDKLSVEKRNNEYQVQTSSSSPLPLATPPHHNTFPFSPSLPPHPHLGSAGHCWLPRGSPLLGDHHRQVCGRGKLLLGLPCSFADLTTPTPTCAAQICQQRGHFPWRSRALCHHLQQPALQLRLVRPNLRPYATEGRRMLTPHPPLPILRSGCFCCAQTAPWATPMGPMCRTARACATATLLACCWTWTARR